MKWLLSVLAKRNTRADVFDIPAEWVIAQGRLFLCSLSLVVIYLDPPRPAHYANYTYFLLAAYLVYALGLVAATNWRLPDIRSQLGIHAGDVIATSLLLFITQGPTSPFTAFFTFILLAATLRWSWRGVLATLVVLVVAFALSTVSLGPLDLTAGPPESLVLGTVIRAAYLCVMAGMLAYVAVYRELNHERLIMLAAWPAYAVGSQGLPPFASALAHAANVLAAPRIIVIWEQSGENSLRLASWTTGIYQQNTETDGSLADIVAVPLKSAVFATNDVSSDFVLLRTGPARVKSPYLDKNFLAKFEATALASASFAGNMCRGRIFILDRSDWNDDHLLLMEIISSRITVELDRQILQAQAEDAAAMRERVRLARDLHDGVLQSLTAAGLQLRLSSQKLDDETRNRIEMIAKLLATEQRRIREFVQGTRGTAMLDRKVKLVDGMGRALNELASVWNCALSLMISPPGLALPSDVTDQLTLLLSESIANSVRHGRASKTDMTICLASNMLEIKVRDNGTGFHTSGGSHPSNEGGYLQSGPMSLRERVEALRGSIKVQTYSPGTELQIEIPVV